MLATHLKNKALLCLCCVWLATYTGWAAAGEFVAVDVFHIKRNKNRNLVQYSVYVDKQSCQPKDSEPAHVFWRDLEISDSTVSDILFYEQPAYGIDSQAIKSNKLHLRLKALPERLITIEFGKSDTGCEVTPYVSINKEQTPLDEVYVFAKERWYWLPTVKWIEIRGHTAQGAPVKERINH